MDTVVHHQCIAIIKQFHPNQVHRQEVPPQVYLEHVVEVMLAMEFVQITMNAVRCMVCKFNALIKLSS
jgi:hypothetical protein